MLSSQLTRTVVDVEIVRPSAHEWEVHLTSSHACVGFVTRMGSVYETIDVLPPYEVDLCGGLEEALQEIYDTLNEANAPLLSVYGAGRG